MSTVVEGINTGMVAAGMIYRLLDRPTRIRDPERPRAIARPHSSLQFEQVCFGYGRELVLRDVSFKVSYGTNVALVGPNGSGKSSLVHLLCRFYDPRKGQIRIDGVDVREISLTDLRGRIGLVTQSTELFNETIMYNIKYGCLERTDEEAIAAAKLAHAHDFIMASTPNQYQTLVGQNGHRLSGGQRQRVALARAFLRDPEILVLDEATSQIDIESEQLIHAAIERLGRYRTVIMITHRKSMLELADVVFAFQDGRVSERAGRQQRVA
jgi:ATP-binding cassette subfamily B protein/subfamily B ATP-binding cassette protein MsbA